MRILLAVFKGCAVVVVAFIALVILASISTTVGIVAACVSAGGFVIALWRPIDVLWISNKPVAVLGIIISLLALLGGLSSADSEHKKRLADLREKDPQAYIGELTKSASDGQIVEEAASLFKGSDPARYLSIIKGRVSDERFMADLKALDPTGLNRPGFAGGPNS